MDKNILTKIFPPTNDIALLNYDMEGLWSITLPIDADEISQIICREAQGTIILDGTSGLGGNVISFSKYFKKVIAVEMNSSRFTMLKSNILAYNITNIELINDDCMNHLDKEIDIYFFDPPWGGPEYKNNSKIIIKLGDKNFPEIINSIKKLGEKKIFLKLPYNYDLSDFDNFNYKVYKIKKYIIVMI